MCDKSKDEIGFLTESYCLMYTLHAYISRLQSLNHIGEDAEIYQITEINVVAKLPFETASHVE